MKVNQIICLCCHSYLKKVVDGEIIDSNYLGTSFLSTHNYTITNMFSFCELVMWHIIK